MDGFVLFNLGSASNVGGNISNAKDLGRSLEYAFYGLYPTFRSAFLAFLELMEEDDENEEEIRTYLNSMDKLNKEEMNNILEKFEFKIMRAP